jgi:hypothetical protein
MIDMYHPHDPNDLLGNIPQRIVMVDGTPEDTLAELEMALDAVGIRQNDYTLAFYYGADMVSGGDLPAGVCGVSVGIGVPEGADQAATDANIAAATAAIDAIYAARAPA